MSQDKGTDLATNSPNANTDSSNPQEQRIAEYKQLLNELPEKWQINIETSAGIYTPPEVAGHPIEYYRGKNAMLDQCRAIIQKHIEGLK